MTIESLSGREHETQVHRLLGYAQIHRAPSDAAARGPAISEEYVEKAGFTLWGWSSDEKILGLIGIQDAGEGIGIVRDLAVEPIFRGEGIGHVLIAHAHTMFEHLAGDTLASAAGFYRSCGFDVTVSGALPDGRELLRFTSSGQQRLPENPGKPPRYDLTQRNGDLAVDEAPLRRTA